ncbi:MAG: hypothetical protein NC191_06970 [Muribaculaceae bacterium]|nr:hypothetical protein [Muribaculaceae bacterium]
MERKLKFAEFAELIGTTAKTVYKMEEREEIITVTEKVNNRQTRLVITNDEQIEYFKGIYRKSPVNNINYEDMLTDNESSVTNNNHSQFNNNQIVLNDVYEKILSLNEEYTIKLNKVSEELAKEKAKVYYLEDKANKEPEYLHQINELNNQKIKLEKESERLVTEKEQLLKESDRLKNEGQKLRTYNNILVFLTVTVIIVFLLVLVSSITYNVVVNNGYYPEHEKKQSAQQEIVQDVQKPAKQTVRKK